MSIPRMSSQDFNNILKDLTNKVETTNLRINNIKKDIENKIKILDYENEYIHFSMSNSSFFPSYEGEFLRLDNIVGGVYDTYKHNIHPKFKKKPYDIFNIDSVGSDIPFFKDDVKVKINGVENDYFKNIIMSNSNPNKIMYFEEFSVDIKDIEIEITDSVDSISSLNLFNVIEINPFLQGSFNIDSIKIYSDDTSTVSKEILDITKAGKTRIILDKKYHFKKLIVNISTNYSTTKKDNKIIPFGIDTLSLKEGNFRTDSYVIFKYESNGFIDSIEDDIKIFTATGEVFTSLDEIGAKVYLDYNNGELSSYQETSKSAKKTIARNTKVLYIKIPTGEMLDDKNLHTNVFSAIEIVTVIRGL